MGQAFRKLFDTFFGNTEMRVVMLGLDAAGKNYHTLQVAHWRSAIHCPYYWVQRGEKFSIRNVVFTVWDVGGQEKLRPLWRALLQQHRWTGNGYCPRVLFCPIYVVDSLDRERIGRAKAEFQTIVKDPFMLNSIILVFANKQDMKGAMTPMEVWRRTRSFRNSRTENGTYRGLARSGEMDFMRAWYWLSGTLKR
ncbi:hypothetical protein NC652_041799 [Populus alba x Populus x berolinensis]|nr:hypothetical protein NC652_041799 [Populus alba x Populus x berolinensis]